MRAITVEEIEQIAGGLAKQKQYAGVKTLNQTLTPITVTGTPPGGTGGGILPVGGGGSGGVGGSPVAGIGHGGSGGGGGVSNADKQLIQNLSEAIAKELSEGLYADDPAELAKDIQALADLSGSELGLEYTWMSVDISQYYENPVFPGSHAPNPTGAPVNPNIINWGAYDDGGSASAEQTIKNMVNSLQAGHPLAIDHNWSS